MEILDLKGNGNIFSPLLLVYIYPTTRAIRFIDENSGQSRQIKLKLFASFNINYENFIVFTLNNNNNNKKIA